MITFRKHIYFLLLFAFAVLAAHADTTAFTYQGRLVANGAPASGSYDFRFRLAMDPLGNDYVGGPVLSNGVPVDGGLFVITLDFGSGVFNGNNYWLEINVKTNGGPGYTALHPLQPITPAPYAIYASGASNVLGTLSSSALAGAYENAVTFSNPTNVFAGNGSALVNVNAATVGGVAASNLWQLTGNVATSNHFLGTLNNHPLDLRANNRRALRLEAAGSAVNVIAGWSNNIVAPAVTIATIAGGGGESAVNVGLFYTNRVLDAYGTIGGGLGNVTGNGSNGVVDARGATVGGGAENVAASLFSTVAGGNRNVVAREYSVIAGGHDNRISLGPDGSTSGDATIGGGYNNINTGWAATIAGGWQNIAAGTSAFIGGGTGNSASNNYASVVGGAQNRVDSLASVILGGIYNLIDLNASLSIIGGGYSNRITSNTYSAVIGGGQLNVASNANATVGGGGNNSALGLSSTVAGGFDNKAVATDSAIVGGYLNVARGYRSFIGAGTGNTASNQYTVISGGLGNTASGDTAVIGGGNVNAADGGFSVIAGGVDNKALGFLSTISGGQGHRAEANNSTIAGGLFNTNNGVLAFIGAGGGNLAANAYAVIGGGQNNLASGHASVVGGGVSNRASGAYSTIAGGGNNASSGRSAFVGGGGGYDSGGGGPYPNTASGDWSVVAGGWNQIASGYSSTIAGGGENRSSALYSSVGGGNQNLATNQYATVPGGGGNVAGGFASFAAGFFARTTNNGAFVWADATAAGATSTNNHSVTMRAAGGYRLFSGASQGVYLAPNGGSWISMSDRNAKENFEPVNPRSVLDKVMALPVSTWNYRAQTNGIRHMGPMAQDFKAAFGIGETETGITTVDADGVAFAAIQGLNQKLEEQSAQNAELRRELSELKQLVHQLTQKH